MAQATQDKNVSELKKEVRLLRSFVIGFAGKDQEGEYRPQFVQKILKAASKGTTKTFKDSTSFLKELRK
ncbi:MAG TPA: DUF2683 family protein [Candidatus Paceibacterota bacterium]